MRSIMNVLSVILLMAMVVNCSPAQQRTVEGKGEEYHHAMFLNFKHAAEEAEALFTQTALPHALNVEIAREHIDEIWTNLDRARVEHAMVHKTFGSEESKMIAENHEGLLLAHTKAIDAAKILKTEIGKEKPDIDVIRMQSAVAYQQSLKAAEMEMEAMKKLGLMDMKKPS